MGEIKKLEDSFGTPEISDAQVREELFAELETAVDRESKLSPKFRDLIQSLVMRLQSKAYVRGYNKAVHDLNYDDIPF